MRFLPQMNPVLLHDADPESCGTVEPPSKGGIVILACVRRDSAETDTETDRGTKRGSGRYMASAIWGLDWIGGFLPQHTEDSINCN